MGSIIKLGQANVDFSHEVERLVKKDHISYIDAVLALSEKFEIEPESAAKLLTRPIKDRIEKEAIDLNFKKNVNELPFD